MAALNFPNSPSTNDLHTENGVTFKWNGTIWKRVSSAYTDATNLNVTGLSTFVGNAQFDANVSIGGTLTYEDVKNIDSVGVITARDDIKLTAAEGKLEATGSTGLTLNASHGSAYARIRTAGSERFRIGTGGQIGLSGANYGSSGQVLTSQGSGSAVAWSTIAGLTYFTESANTSSPNNSVAANRFIATGSGSNIDYVASPKGTGANLSQLPDSGTGGGNKRGTYATDWQKERDNANQVASGNYSSIGGGRKNRASGIYSHIGGGQQNTATGHADVVAGGEDSDATGGNSTVGGGYLNKAQSSGTTVAGGVYNTAAQSYTTIVGGARGKTRWQGHTVLGGHGDTVMGSNGGQQAGLTVYQRQTTDATPTTISTMSNSSGDTLRLVTLPNNSAYGFTITLVAAVTGGGNSSMWKYQGLIKRGGNAGSTAIVGSVVKDRIAYDSGASAWDADAAADTTNGSIKITVTGQSSTTIRWLARIETTELTYS